MCHSVLEHGDTTETDHGYDISSCWAGSGKKTLLIHDTSTKHMQVTFTITTKSDRLWLLVDRLWPIQDRLRNILDKL